MSADTPVTEGFHYSRLWYTLAVVGVLLVIAVSLWPRPPEILFTFRFADKLWHMTAYFVMMGWYVQLVSNQSARLVLVVAFVSLGIGIEFLQEMSGSRFFDWWDAVANSLGVLLAWIAGFSRFENWLGRFDRWWHARSA